MKISLSWKTKKPAVHRPITHPISQILISAEKQIPPKLLARMATVKDFLGDSAYELFDDRSLRDFIKQHFPNEVVAAYDALRPNSYKADLGRYCILYQRGGWYVDAGVIWTSAYTPPDDMDYVVFRDIQQYSRTSWACATSVIFARPAQAFLQKSIELVMENVKTKYYGLTPLCPTGPTLMGRALAIAGANPMALYGDYIHLTPTAELKNSAFVLPNGQILAMGKNTTGGDLSSLGVVGTNNYNKLWRAGNIYK